MPLTELPPVRWATAVYSRHPEAIGATLTAAAGLVLLAVGVHGTWGSIAVVPRGSVSPWFALLLLLGCAVMLVKRRAPLVALGAGTALFLVDSVLGGSIGMLLVFFDLLYSAANWGSQRARSVLLGAITIVTIAAIVIPASLGTSAQYTVLFGLQAFAILVTPYWWATAVRQGRELAASEAARADDATRFAGLERDEAVREERSRMARDLHDVIASNLSAVAIHSAAALARESDMRRDRQALEAVRAASIDGLDQMRSMIMVLRSGDGDELTAPVRLKDLPELIARSALTVQIEGEPPMLATATDQAMARIIAESLVNAAKHTPGAAVLIRFGLAEGAAVVQVESSGGVDAAAAGTGHGILTMRERAERLGGTLTAGPVGHSWLVIATLPGAPA